MAMENTYVWMGALNPFLLFMAGLLSLLISFVPSFIAFAREHPNRLAILLLNILFGWTGIGWIILMVWAFDRPVRNRQLQ